MTLASLILSLAVVAIAASLMRWPALARRVSDATTATLGAVERRPARVALIVGVCWMAWLGYAIVRDDRPAIPRSHDEQSYLLQARIYASGDLWLPTPPAADFFDTFHVLVRPVYASRYPPGTALAHAPALALGLPWIATSLVLTAVGLAAFAYAGVRLAGPWAVPVIVAAAFTGGQFMTNALEAMSQPALLAATGLFWAIAARRRAGPLAFALAGLVAGFAFLVRPLDATVLLAPPALWMFARASRGPRGRRRIVVGAACGTLAFAPSLAFMLCLDRGMTGSYLRTPWGLYAEQSQPGERIGFSTPAVGHLPATAPPQKRALYERYVRPALLSHTLPAALGSWLVPGGRGAVALSVIAGPPLVILAVPFAIYGAWRRRLVALASSVGLLLALYTAVAFGGGNYYLPIAPLVWIAAAAGLDAAVRRFGRGLAGGAMLVLVLVVLASQLPIAANAASRTSESPFEEMRYLHDKLDPAIKRPAIVFYRYRDGVSSFHDEPVYNLDTADPTAGPIVRAHWLGVRNRELLGALGERRGDSEVYVYDRGSGRLVDLGTVRDALRVPPPPTSAAAPATAPVPQR